MHCTSSQDIQARKYCFRSIGLDWISLLFFYGDVAIRLPSYVRHLFLELSDISERNAYTDDVFQQMSFAFIWPFYATFSFCFL